MKKQTVNQKTRVPYPAGFTLIEILLTIAIIVALLGLILTVGYLARKNARRASTLTAMQRLTGISDQYARLGLPPLLDAQVSRYYGHVGAAGNPASPATCLANANTIYRLRLPGSATDLRPMTTMEYFTWQTEQIPSLKAQLFALPENTYVPVVPVATDAAHPEGVALFDVYRHVTFPDGSVQDIQAAASYPLRTVVDAWEDLDTWSGYGSFSQATAPRKHEMRFCSRASSEDLSSIPPLPVVVPTTDPANPYLDGAMPYYGYPYFASAGPDGKWGALRSHDGVALGFDAAVDAAGDAADNLYSYTGDQ